MNWLYLMPVLWLRQGSAKHCSSDCARRQTLLYPGNETFHCLLWAVTIITGVDQIKDFTEVVYRDMPNFQKSKWGNAILAIITWTHHSNKMHNDTLGLLHKPTYTRAAFSVTVTGRQVGPVSWPAVLLMSPVYSKHTHTHTVRYTCTLVSCICSESLLLSLSVSRFLISPTPHSLWFYVTPPISSFLSLQWKDYDYLPALNIPISHSCFIPTPIYLLLPPVYLPLVHCEHYKLSLYSFIYHPLAILHSFSWFIATCPFFSPSFLFPVLHSSFDFPLFIPAFFTVTMIWVSVALLQSAAFMSHL